MKPISPRTLSILRDIAPALDAARKADGYYPSPVAVRAIIAARHGEQAANTLYHNRLAALLRQHIAPLYSGPGARQFARTARKQIMHKPLQGFDWWHAHPSPFVTALDWLHWKLERLTVGETARVRSDLRIVRTDMSRFQVYAGSSMLPVVGGDYGQAVARLMAVLLFGGTRTKSARPKRQPVQFGSRAVV